MSLKTTKRVATASALTLFATLGLSACGGSSNGIPDDVYVQRDDANGDGRIGDILSVHDGQVSEIEYIGSKSRSGNSSTAEKCGAFKTFIGDAEDGSINPDGVEGSYKIKNTGPINDDGDTVVWEDRDPESIAADTPDTDMLTIGDEIYVPSSDDGAKAGIEKGQENACDQA